MYSILHWWLTWNLGIYISSSFVKGLPCPCWYIVYDTSVTLNSCRAFVKSASGCKKHLCKCSVAQGEKR